MNLGQVPAQPNAYDCGIFTIFYAAIVFSRGDWFKDVVQSQLDLVTAVTSGTHVGFAIRWNAVKMITDLRDGIRNALAAEVQDDAVRLTTGDSDESDDSEVEVLVSSHPRTLPRKKLPRGCIVPSYPICKDDFIDID